MTGARTPGDGAIAAGPPEAVALWFGRLLGEVAPVLDRVPMTTTGGSAPVVVLTFAALLVATGLSVYLAVRLYRGYRRGGNAGMLVLGVGLVLLTTVPLVLRLVLSNVQAVDVTVQEIAATGCQLAGLLLILGVIYVRR